MKDKRGNLDFDVDETGWYAKDLVKLEGEDLELFNRFFPFSLFYNQR